MYGVSDDHAHRLSTTSTAYPDYIYDGSPVHIQSLVTGLLSYLVQHLGTNDGNNIDSIFCAMLSYTNLLAPKPRNVQVSAFLFLFIWWLTYVRDHVLKQCRTLNRLSSWLPCLSSMYYALCLFFPIFAFQGTCVMYISDWYLPRNKLELILNETLIHLSNIQPLWSSMTLSWKKITKYRVTAALEIMHYLAGWSSWKSGLSPPLP